jgi:hypothetical protein
VGNAGEVFCKLRNFRDIDDSRDIGSASADKNTDPGRVTPDIRFVGDFSGFC